MDFDFDEQPSDAAPAARAGAKFKPKGRPQPKKKQVSVSTSQTTLTTDVAKGKFSATSEDPVPVEASSVDVSVSETIVPDTGTINQTTIGTISKQNVLGGVSVLRACTSVNLEGKRCDDGTEAVPEFPDDPRIQDSAAFGDVVTRETDEVTDGQTETMQREEEECYWNMENLNIVQEERITSAYEEHTGKFQPKPRLLDTVIEEPESHYSVEYTTGANHSEFVVNVESRNEFNTNSTFYSELQEEEHNIPEIPRDTVPGGSEHEHHVVSPSTNNTAVGEEENLGNTVEETRSGKESKKGKPKRARKRKTNSEEEPNKSKEAPEKKKFKHSSRRQRNRTLEKELLETPDEEIRFLPIRDMLRLVEYREWMEKKEAKAAPVEPPPQESNTNASDNQYYSQGFDAEDEFGLEEGENQDYVVKPDSPPVNYQTYMNKTPRARWSKQDTELFYEGIREFGSNLSMVQQLFPDRTRQQIKLKFKLEERRFPLKLNDALSTRSKQLVHYHTVIKKLQEEAAAAREGEEEEEAGEDAETTTDVPENEEPAKSEETEGVADVKESEGGDIENGLRSDGVDEWDDGNEGDDDDDFWNSYKSEM